MMNIVGKTTLRLAVAGWVAGVLITLFILVPCTYIPSVDPSYGRWDIVVTRALLMVFFVLFIPFKIKLSRRSSGLYTAFIVALYAEMYGFPVTLYVLTWLFEYQTAPPPYRPGSLLLNILPLELYEWSLFFTEFVMVITGLFLIFLGWSEIYKDRGKFIHSGLYGFVRHPQYLGILIVTLGFLIAWPTLLTSIMYPILAVLYYRLAKEEEREMEKRFGEGYRQYKQRVPMFLPLRLKFRKESKKTFEKRRSNVR